MESALNLYRGELLAGFNVEDAAPFEEWLFYVRGQLGRNLTQVLQHQREQAEQNQDWARVIVALRQLITLDNLNEELYFALMQTYLANGERKTALDLYVEWRDLLETELHLAPQPQVTALYNKIRQSPAIQSNPATLPSESTARPKLPTALTSLIGREAEIQNIKELISRPQIRLLTLTGAGGSGKTRLAIEVVRELYPDFQAGVYFVTLATLNESSPEQIAATIANTLGLKESADTTRVQQLIQHLSSSQQMLLVLDNFEQLVAAASFVEDLLKSAPKLKLIVTSRFLLKVYGEYEYQVQPLALPQPQPTRPPSVTVVADLLAFPAIALFVERAQAVKQTFHLNLENAHAITEVCRRLDGLPLAIELVAARVKFFTPQALMTRLDKRLDLATGGSRTLAQRQQTLRATIEWSYGLLEDSEKQFFNRLACFVEGFSSQAALAVGANLATENQLLDMLFSFVDKSLVQSSYDGQGEPRFSLLETIKEFGLEKLEAQNDLEKTLDKQAAFFFALADFNEQVKNGANQTKLLALLQQEHANVKATLDWFIAQADVRSAYIFSACLSNFWNVKGHYNEGRTYLAKVLTLTGLTELIWRARVLLWAGVLAMSQEDYTSANNYFQASLELYRQLEDRDGLARVLGNLGIVAKNQKNYPLARHFHEESLTLFQELGDKGGMSRSLNNLGQVAVLEDDLEEAQHCFASALELRRAVGDQNGIAIGLNNMCEVAYHLGKYEIARAYAEESLSLSREINNKIVIAAALDFLGKIAYAQGNLQMARENMQEQALLLREIDSKNKLARCLTALGNITLAQGEYELASGYYRESLNLFQQLGDSEGVNQSVSGVVRTILGEEAKAPQLVMIEPERAIKLVYLVGALSKLVNPTENMLAQPLDETNYTNYVERVRAAIGQARVEQALAEGRTFSLEQVMEQLQLKVVRLKPNSADFA
jgi:predicted ATPase